MVFAAAVLVTSGAVVAPAGATAASSPAAPATRDVIVRFNDGTDVRAEAAALAAQGATVFHQYATVFPGLAARVPAQAVDALSLSPQVAYVEADQTVSVTSTQVSPPWGLDRIDQRDLPLSGTYGWATDGGGVTAYVVDTGILATHTEFAGRVGSGYTSINDGVGTTDCHGHGTHVAGTVGGSTYGVAKSVDLVPVRVLGCDGRGTTSGVVAGLDWILQQHPSGAPGVVNMSLGGSAAVALDDAVARVRTSGVSVVVAAGNSAADACNSSPARAAAAVTVGATASTDTKASFSNYGVCLDLFAPGVGVRSASIGTTTASTILSGTSMAAPHVAGVVALAMAQDPTADVGTVEQRVLAAATPDRVVSAGEGSPNLLVHSLVVPPPPPVIPDPVVDEPPADTPDDDVEVPGDVPAAPSSVSLATQGKALVVTWVAGDDGGSPITAHTVTIYQGTRVVGSWVAEGDDTTLSLANVKLNRNQVVGVSATNAAGTGPEAYAYP